MGDRSTVHQLSVQSGAFKNFTYIIVDNQTRKAAVIDPAWELESILRRLRDIGAELEAVLLTHSHFDHVNLVDPLVDRYQPAVYMHRDEIEFYRYRSENLISLHHNDKIRIGNTEIVALHAPGHTKGSICYLTDSHLFSGDTIFTEGCGVCNMEGGSPHDMFRSLQYLKKRIADDTAVYPGHSFGKRPGHLFRYLVQNNIYLAITNEKTFVDFRMRQRPGDADFAFH